MSADNWMTCPRCRAKAVIEHQKKVEELKADYGKVPAEEFLKRTVELENGPKIPGDNCREDYEFDLSDSYDFFASYRASCADCGFSYTFKHEENVAAYVKTDET